MSGLTSSADKYLKSFLSPNPQLRGIELAIGEDISASVLAAPYCPHRRQRKQQISNF